MPGGVGGGRAYDARLVHGWQVDRDLGSLELGDAAGKGKPVAKAAGKEPSVEAEASAAHKSE